MSNSELIILFLQISVMLLFALIFRWIMVRVKQPTVFGEFLAGIILGPTILGTVTPSAFFWLFQSSHAVAIAREAVIQLGMLFFLFSAGLEVNLTYLRQHKKTVILTGSLSIFIPFVLGFVSVITFPNIWQSIAVEKSHSFPFFIATALSISALPVIAKILMDIDLIRKDLGQVIMAAATVNDLIGWTLFAIILSTFLNVSLFANNIIIVLGSLLGFSIFIWGVRRWVGKRLLMQTKGKEPSQIVAVITILILVAASFMQAIGIHAIFGAFILGVALSSSRKKGDYAHKVIYQFAVSFFAPIYFVSIGLQTNFLENFDLILVLFILTVASIGKICGAGFGAWISGFSFKKALAIGFGMNARGAIEIILASIALEYKLIDERIFVALIVMALVTSMISGPVMQALTSNSR
ncbi:MAG TPA: cation:proton antiporter [bacterium]